MGYHPCLIGILISNRERAGGQSLVGSLTGVVASERVTEAFKESLSMVGNRSKSVKVKGSLTVRPTSRAGAKAGLSDQAIQNGMVVA